MKNSDNVTFREIYELIDKKMEKVNNSIENLTDKFDSLESGRLSSVEKDVASMKGQAMMVPLFITIAVNGFFFILNNFLNK